MYDIITLLKIYTWLLTPIEKKEKMMDETFQIENKKDHLRVTLPDSVTMRNLLQIQNRIEDRLSGSFKNVVLDLSNIIGIYSILVGLILKIKNMAIKSGSSFYLVNVSKQCLEQIESMELDETFNIFKDEKDFHIQDN